MQLMLKGLDTLFRVWDLAVSFLGLPPLPLVHVRELELAISAAQAAYWKTAIQFRARPLA